MQGFYPANLSKEYQGILPYAYGSQDPRVVATPGTEGQLYLLLPDGELFRKLDSGSSTNWEALNLEGNGSSVYLVSELGPYTGIQQAIDQAVLDGHTDNNNPAVIVVCPKNGYYEEVVNIYPGIHVQGVNETINYAVKVRGGFIFTGAYSGDNFVDSASISNLFILDNVAGDECIEYSTTTATTLALERLTLRKNNTAATALLVNAIGGNLIASNLFIDSNQANINIEILSGGFLSPFSFSTISGGSRAIRKSGPDQALFLGTTINYDGDDAAVLIEQGQIIFGLGGITNNNAGNNAAAFFVNAGAFLIFNNGTLIIADNVVNKAISGQAGGFFMYLLPVFATANDRVEAALTSVLQNSTPNFV